MVRKVQKLPTSPGREVSRCREADSRPMWIRSDAVDSVEVVVVVRAEMAMEMGRMARATIMETALLEPDNNAPAVVVKVAAAVDAEEGPADSADPPVAMVLRRVEKAGRIKPRRKEARKSPRMHAHPDAVHNEADGDVGKDNRKVLKAARVARGRRARDRIRLKLR